MKKVNKIVTLLFVLAVLFGNVSAATIEKIDVINNSTVELTASQDVVFSDIKIIGDVKLLKDIPVSLSLKDSENTKKVVINLSSDLIANTSYSLISVLGADGNIDFNIGDFLEGEIINSNLSEDEEGIVKVNIIDSRTMELYFTSDILEDTFEFKILSEIPTNGLKSSGNNVLQILVKKALENKTNYIAMVLALQDASGNVIKFDEDLYDFITSDNLQTIIVPEEEVVAVVYTEPEEIVEGNVEDIALNVAETTPETGAETSILILFTLFVSLAFFFRKRFVK